MFRCHFTKLARIVQDDYLAAKTLDGSIAEGQRLLAARSDLDELNGILTWENSSFTAHLPLLSIALGAAAGVLPLCFSRAITHPSATVPPSQRHSRT